MGGLVLAWLAGEGIVTYRWIKAGAPPTPRAQLAVSGFFALLAVVAQYPPARTAATLTAVGIDIAALLQVLPGSKAQQNTGWPPPVITDTSVILPTGHSHGAPASNPSGGSGPGGGPVPSGPNVLPPGQAPPPNQGVIFPPGSSLL
jgi:hypothetical protein